MIFNEIRQGNVSEESISLLVTRLEFHPDEGEQETKLFTHNSDVDRINKMYLEQIGGASKVFKAETKGNKVLVDVLKKSVLAMEDLELRRGEIGRASCRERV